MNQATSNPNFHFVPFRSLLRREVLRFSRVLAQTLLIPLVNSTLYLLIFGVSLGSSITISEGISYLAFLIPGLMMMAILNNSFQNSSSSISTSRFHGDLEDLRVVPLSTHQIVLALGCGGLIRGALVGLITLSVGEIFHFFYLQRVLPISHPSCLLLFVFMGGLSFSLLGIIAAFKAKSIDHLSAIGGFILLPLMYLGGVFFSLQSLHPFWRLVSQFNPLLYFMNGMRFSFIGTSDIPLPTSILVGVLTLVLLYFLALITVRRASFSRW